MNLLKEISKQTNLYFDDTIPVLKRMRKLSVSGQIDQKTLLIMIGCVIDYLVELKKEKV